MGVKKTYYPPKCKLCKKYRCWQTKSHPWRLLCAGCYRSQGWDWFSSNIMLLCRECGERPRFEDRYECYECYRQKKYGREEN